MLRQKVSMFHDKKYFTLKVHLTLKTAYSFHSHRLDIILKKTAENVKSSHEVSVVCSTISNTKDSRVTY